MLSIGQVRPNTSVLHYLLSFPMASSVNLPCLYLVVSRLAVETRPSSELRHLQVSQLPVCDHAAEDC